MKKKNLTLIIVLTLCLVLFVAFWMLKRQQTDTTPPQITIADETQIPAVSVRDPQSVLLQGITARDDRDGDVTASVIIERLASINDSCEVLVTYAAFDSSGNVAKASRTIRYTDYEGPRFSLTEPLIYTQGAYFDVLDAVVATDWVDGDIRHKIKTTLLDGAVLTDAGIHNVQFRVTNTLGDTEELVLPVEVQYAGSHSAQLSLTDYLIYLNAGSRFRAEDYLLELIWRNQRTDLTGRVPATMELTVDGTVDLLTPGIYPVTYTLTDDAKTWSAYSKLIVVVEG